MSKGSEQMEPKQRALLELFGLAKEYCRTTLISIHFLPTQIHDVANLT